MPSVIESRRGNLLISTDPARVDVDAIVDMLARAYWAEGRTREAIVASLTGSLVFGVYDGARQIGLARVVSDFATFAWLCDVFVHEDYRGRAIGKWLMEFVLAHPDLQGVRRFLLATRDAHGLYLQYGFTPLGDPARWMERTTPPAPKT